MRKTKVLGRTSFSIIVLEILSFTHATAAPRCNPAHFPGADRLELMKGRDGALYLAAPDGSDRICTMHLQTGAVELSVSDQLTPETAAAEKTISGTWHDLSHENSLDLIDHGDYIQIDGTATADMSTANDPMDIRAAVVSGRIKINSGWSDPVGECHVQAKRVGPALVVKQRDDTSCGGYGVSFSGVYTRR
jgi:hypothetical protein